MFLLYVNGSLVGEYTNMAQVELAFKRLCGPMSYTERIALLNGRAIAVGCDHIQLLTDDETADAHSEALAV